MQIFLYFRLSKNSHVPPPESYLGIEPRHEVIGQNIGLIRLQLIYFCSDLSFNYCKKQKKKKVNYHPQLSVSLLIGIRVGEGYCSHERAYAHLQSVRACLYLQLEDL